MKYQIHVKIHKATGNYSYDELSFESEDAVEVSEVANEIKKN